MRLKIVDTNNAGKINVLIKKETVVIAPTINGLRIVPDVTEPVDIKIPINIGIIMVIVLDIVLTTSRDKL